MKKVGTTNIRGWFWMLLIVLGFITGGLAYYRYEAGYIRDRKYREIAAVAELKVGQIRQWRWERLADARLMTNSPFFQKAVADWLVNPYDRDMQADLQARLSLVVKEHLYAEVLLCDLNGHILLSSRPEEEHSIPPITEELEKAGAEGRALLGECFRGPNGEVYLDTLSPVPTLAGGPMVVVVLRSRMEDLLYPLIRSWPIPSQTAESLLVRREGKNVLFLNELRHRPASALSLTYPLTRTDIPAVQAVLGKQGRFEGNDYRNEKVLAELRPVPGSRWFMVVKVDTREILAQARYRGWVTLVFVILLVVFVVLINAYGHRHRLAALYEEMFRTERESKGMLQAVFDGIPEPLVLLDKDMRVKVLNKGAIAYFGLTETREVIGEFCYKAFKDESNLCKGCRFQAVFKTENMNFERKGIMDPLRDEKVYFYPLYQKNGEPAEIIYRINDITERKMFAKRMIQNEKMASLGVLVSTIAHEINNPNAFITFNTPILKEYIEQLIGMIDDYSKTNPELELFNMSYSDFRMDIFRLIGNIEHGSERIGAIVSNLKEFSRTQYIGNGKQVDLTTVAEKALSICRAKVKKTVKSFTVNIPEDFPRIHADPIALEQILINLLINAAQAADKVDSWIRLSAAIGRTWLDHTIIEVQDNGCGIDEKNMNNIFDPFFSTKPAAEGTGLGLYVCHDLVSVHP